MDKLNAWVLSWWFWIPFMLGLANGAAITLWLLSRRPDD